MEKQVPLKKTILLIVAAVLTTLVVMGAVLWGFLDFGGTKFRLFEKMNSVYDTIEQHYLFDYDEDKLVDYMATGLVAGLEERYSTYYTEEAYNQKHQSDKGTLVGIGANVMSDLENNTIKLEKIWPNSPAEEAGLRAGDLIVAVDGVLLSEMEPNTATTKIQGEENTEVVLRVRREGQEQDYTLIRKEVEAPSIESRMIGDNGYIKILDFTEVAAGRFKEAVDSLQEQGATALVFDLRHNTGGLMDTVNEMLDYLVPEGVICYTEDRDGNRRAIKNSDKQEITLPMITITDEETASASELFVAVLKDYNKAKSVGTKTFGKGIVQQSFGYGDGTGIKITSTYFTAPNSENFHGKGIEPDYEVMLSEDQKENLNALDETNDPQLQKALAVLDEEKEAE